MSRTSPYQFNPFYKPQNWVEEFGYTAEELTDQLMGDGYLNLPGAATVVKELPMFGLQAQMLEPDDRDADDDGMPYGFAVGFRHKGQRSDLSLEIVNFAAQGANQRYAGRGSEFLRRTLRTAIRVGSSRVLTNPGLEGSWFWPRRGAKILAYPSQRNREIFDDRIKKLVAWPERRPGWSARDIESVASLLTSKDPMLLNHLVVRDDLLVFNGEKVLPFARHLFQDVSFGTCIIGLDDEWSRACLQTRLGFDVDAERAALAPARPARNETIKAAPLALDGPP